MAGPPRKLSVQDPFAGPLVGGLTGRYVMAPAPSGGDDYATVQALINTYSPLGITIIPSVAEYLLSAELSAPSTAYGEILRGTPGKYDVAQGTRFKLIGAARSCFATTDVTKAAIHGITFNANRLGSYGAFFNGFTWGKVESCTFLNGLLDGLHLGTDPHGCDTNRFADCFFDNNGTTYATAGVLATYPYGTRATIAGTVSTIAGNPVITYTGAQDLTLLGIRRGELIRIHYPTPQLIQIESVTTNTITAMVNADNLPSATSAGLGFAIGVGAGYYEERGTNNNGNDLYQCVTRGSAVGFSFKGLYGPSVNGGQADFNNFVAVSLSNADNATAFIGAQFNKLYAEQVVAGQYFLGQSQDVTIISPNGDATPLFASSLQVSDCAIIRNGRHETLKYGAEQSFVFEVTRTAGGVLQHHFVSDLVVGSGSSESDKINGASPAYANTPVLDGGATPFASGAGTFGNAIVFDTAPQGIAPFGILVFERNSTGASVRVSLASSSANINGVTRQRTVLRLLDASGAEVSWAATIGNSQTIAVRADIRIR